MAPGEALDAALLELLEALEALHRHRGRLHGALREGWLSLSQARYALGCPRVSALQYGATMEPRVRVLPRQDPGGAPRFEEVPGQGGDPEDVSPQLGGGHGGLRQRRGQEENSGPPPQKNPPPRRPPQDPLTWFGVLVPRSLRQAQGSFVEGVTLAVELAGLQGAARAAAERYRALLRGHGDGGDTAGPGDGGDGGDSGTHGDGGTGKDTETPGDIGTCGDIGTHGDVGRCR